MLKKNAGESIPVIWHFKPAIFNLLKLSYDTASNKKAGRVCMLNFSKSGSFYFDDINHTVSNSTIEPIAIFESLKKLNFKYTRAILLTIDIHKIEAETDIIMKTTDIQNVEVLKNLWMSMFTDLNNLTVDFSKLDSINSIEQLIQIEIIVSEKIFLEKTPVNKNKETRFQDALRMFIYTLIGFFGCM